MLSSIACRRAVSLLAVVSLCPTEAGVNTDHASPAAATVRLVSVKERRAGDGDVDSLAFAPV